MKELKMDEPQPLDLEQFKCQGCEKNFNINKVDFDALEEGTILDCPFCNVHGVQNIALFKIQMNKIFLKEENDIQKESEKATEEPQEDTEAEDKE